MSWGDTPGPLLPSSQHARGEGVLTKTAFFDAPLLVTSVQQVKDYLLVADVHQGIYFVRYKVRNIVSRLRTVEWSRLHRREGYVCDLKP